MDKKKINYDLVDKTRHEVKRRQQKTGKKFTRKQIKRIMAYVLLSFSLGGIVGGKGTLALNAAVENKKDVREIDASGNDTVKINTFKQNLVVDDKTEVYVDGSKIDDNEKDINEQIAKTVQEEVNNLKNSDEVLDYLKDIYVDEYNNVHDQKITRENIELSKRRSEYIYEDTDQNGKNIIRSSFSSKAENSQIADKGIIRAIISDGSIAFNEATTDYFGQYVNVYDENDIIQENEDYLITDLGEVMSTGIDYYAGFVDEKNLEYKGKFIDALEEYKKEKINEIVSPEQTQQSDDGMEIE